MRRISFWTTALLVATTTLSPMSGAAQCPAGECQSIGSQTQFNDVQAWVSPPVVEGPLYACATVVRVSGFVPNATVAVYVGTTQMGTFTSDLPDGANFTLPTPLAIGQVVTARQTVLGMQSDPSVGVTARDHTIDYPSGLPNPSHYSPPYYACGRAVGLSGLVPGATATVTRSWSAPTSVSWSGGTGVVFGASASNSVLDTINASQQLCGGTPAAAPPAMVLSAPMTITPPAFPSAVYAGQRHIEMTGTIFGALVTIERDSVDLSPNGVATGPTNGTSVISLSTALASSGGSLSGRQSLCSITSMNSTRVVSGCAALPAALINYPEIGDTFVDVIERVPGSRIRIYARPNSTSAVTEIGDGGGLRIALRRAVLNGEEIIVIQELGTCRSTSAQVLTARCSTPDRVALPVTGRYGVGMADYDIGTVPLSGPSVPVRRRAHVRFPVDPYGSSSSIPSWTTARPIVFLMHGNRANVDIPAGWAFMPPWPGTCPAAPPSYDGLPSVRCVPPNEVPLYLACGATETQYQNGYSDLMNALARAGIVAVSIFANDTMCDSANNGQLDAGARLFLEHANFWAQLNAGTAPSGHPFGSTMTGRIDMSRTGIFGHSRGGERAVLAPSLNTNPAVTFTTAAAVAPSDNAGSVVATIPLAVFFGSRDGDTLAGDAFRIYDRAASARTLWHVYGTNHNGWNSLLPTNDSNHYTSANTTAFPDITGGQARAILAAYARSWFVWRLLGGESSSAESSAARRVSRGDARWRDAPTPHIYTSYSNGGTMFDNFENNDPANNFFGRPVTVSPVGGFSPFTEPFLRAGSGAPNGTFVHATRGLFAAWTATPPPMFTSLSANGGLNVGSAAFLQFRAAAVQTEPTNNPNDLVLDLRLATLSGGTGSFVRSTSIDRIPAPYPPTPRTPGGNEVGRTTLRTIRVPTRCLVTNPTFLTNVQSLTVQPVGNASALVVDDFQFVNE